MSWIWVTIGFFSLINRDKIIYILLPVHNRVLVTEKFIDCLVQQKYQNVFLILIDDGSQDGTAEMVRRHVKNVKVLRGDGHWWWAGSLHQGWLWLSQNFRNEDDVVLIINDDVTFENDYFVNAVKLIGEKPNFLILSTCYDLTSKKFVDAGQKIDWENMKFRSPQRNEPPDCLSTRGLFMTVRTFVRSGGFFPKCLPHYLSDYEFSIRAKKMGISLHASPDLKVWLVSEKTGWHSLWKPEGTFLENLQRFWSPKNPCFPPFFISFILLACPRRFRMKHVKNQMLAFWGAFRFLVGMFLKEKIVGRNEIQRI
ncbi:MAG: glycosyl transferase family 2 [uncultured bacterium]|nr:MAG: glycosyl transferase family 2 [uncultured bacterium]